jgi:endo-beta-N-acetylglucosaminidase D
MTVEAGSLNPVWFNTADEIFQWKPEQANPLTVATVPLAPRIVTTNPLRMLVGLDNGAWTYWSEFDANPQGGPRGNVYNFPYWQYVDTMYYYVHRLAAVPPAVWTNAAHRNGVKMCVAVTADFGENGEGAKQVDALFAQPERAASQLYLIAKTYGFDGWMIDIENGADPSANVRKAMTALRSMKLPNGQPTEAGYYEAGRYSIDDETYQFFQAGTFFQADYTPAPGYPAQSYVFLQSNGQTGERFATYWAVYVYMYGDSTHGLCNGYNYLDIDAFFAQLAQAKMTPPDSGYYQSICVYAPDWTMYGGHDSTSDPLPTRDKFHETNRLFWVGANPTIAADGTLKTTTPAVSNFIPARSSIVAKPFVTRFNTGEGSFFAVSGQHVANREWNHLSSQDRLPTWLVPVSGSETTVSADYSYTEAYDGGSSLAFQGPLAPEKWVEYALYLTDIGLQETTSATFTYMLRDGRSVLPYLRLIFSDGTSATVQGDRKSGWVTASSDLGRPSLKLVSIHLGFLNTALAQATVDAVVGELRVIQPPSYPPAPPNTLIPQGNGDLLTWSAPDWYTAEWWYYNVFCWSANGLSFVGRTFVTGYDLSAPLFPPPTGAQFRIQPVTTLGYASPLPSE